MGAERWLRFLGAWWFLTERNGALERYGVNRKEWCGRQGMVRYVMFLKMPNIDLFSRRLYILGDVVQDGRLSVFPYQNPYNSFSECREQGGWAGKVSAELCFPHMRLISLHLAKSCSSGLLRANKDPITTGNGQFKCVTLGASCSLVGIRVFITWKFSYAVWKDFLTQA